MKLTSLLLLLFICHTGFSQGNHHFQWFSADSNHLPQNSVKSITPDKYGFLWLSTENGVVRYDGQNFRIFNSENVKGLNYSRMQLFSGNIKKDSILLHNDSGERVLIHNRTVEKINSIKRPEKLLSSLTKDSYLIHPSRYYPDYPHNQNNGIFFSILVKDDTYLFHNDSVSIYNPDYKITSQFKYTCKDSSRFFVTSGKLYRLNKKNEYALYSEVSDGYKKFSSTIKKGVKLYNNTTAQQSFIYSNNELFYLKNGNNGLITQLLLSDFNFETNNIVSVYYDDQNDILYLGSTNKGLLVVKQNDFRHNSTPYLHGSGTDDVYYALHKYNSNSILASTGEIFDKSGETSKIGISENSDKYMLLIDDNGDVWTKQTRELYRFTKKSNFTKFEKWEFKNIISAMAKAPDGNIFIAVEDEKKKGALYTINSKTTLASLKLLLSMESAPTVLNAVNNKMLWAGSSKGLYKIYPDEKKIIKIKNLGNVYVRSITCSANDDVWIGTYGKGLYLYKNYKITHLPLDRNGYLLISHCIVEDHKGLIWITTNKGLFAAKKQDLYDYAANKIKQVYYHIYDKNSGFLNNEFNGGCSPCGVNLDNKAIFFPSMDGIVYFNPNIVNKRQPKSEIFLDYTEVDSLSHTATDSLVFDRRFGKIKFFLSSPYYGTHYNQNIETRLEGPVVQDWTSMTENNVSFSTLPPGHYKLRTRKLGGFGSKYIYKDFNFRITPAFWQTRGFTVVLIVLGLLMAYFIYVLRVRYIKHKNIQLEKQVVLRTEQLQTTVVALRKTKNDLSVQVTNHKNLIKTITHDIKSPLKFIAITGRYLYNSLDKSQPISKDDVKAIYTSSTQLYHFVDNFLDYAKETDLNSNESHPYSLHMLADEKAGFFKNIATAARTTIENGIDARLFITVNRHLLSIILHNLLDNALKNTFEGRISINAIAESDKLSISVADSGAGMKQETVDYYINLSQQKITPVKQNGMGLHMIAELLTITGGSLHIISSEGSGTTVTISFMQNA